MESIEYLRILDLKKNTSRVESLFSGEKLTISKPVIEFALSKNPKLDLPQIDRKPSVKL